MSEDDSFQSTSPSIDAGADDEEEELQLWPLLFAFAKSNNFTAVKQTLSSDPRLELTPIDRVGFNLLHHCAFSNSVDACKEFLQHVKTNHASHPSRYKKFLESKTRKEGDTALHIACRRGHVDLVRLLIEFGSSPYSLNKSKHRPFEVACTADIKRLIESAMVARQRVRLVSDVSSQWVLISSDFDREGQITARQKKDHKAAVMAMMSAIERWWFGAASKIFSE